MSRVLEKIKYETSNDFVELKCGLISERDIKVEILDRSLETDHNITDLVPVKLEKHEYLYDIDVSIKEETFEPCYQSTNEPDKTDFNTTHDIRSASCDRNKDVTHSNDEDSFDEDIFSTQIEFTPTQTEKTLNSRDKISAKRRDDKLFSCGICSKLFSSSKDLFSHSHHNDLKTSEDKLKKDMKINASFSQTARTQPNKKKSQIKFKTVADMLQTVNKSKIKGKSKRNDNNTKTSSKQKIQQCGFCGQIFTFYNNLLRHQKKHSDGRVVCDYCQKDYNRKSYLAEHIKVVHLKIARNNTVFMCVICNKRLRSAYALRCHMRIHTGKKPFRCDVCKKEFSNKWNFEVHCKSKKHNCSLKS